MIVRGIETFTDSAPYPDCWQGGLALQALQGLCIGSGWTRAVRERLPASHTCTHLRELLLPLASAAYQALTEHRRLRPEAVDIQGKPIKIDSCYAYGSTRSLVRRRWPGWAGKE